jgi:hypothetical protein
MDELPTVVVDPLPQSMVEHSWLVAAERFCLLLLLRCQMWCQSCVRAVT